MIDHLLIYLVSRNHYVSWTLIKFEGCVLNNMLNPAPYFMCLTKARHLLSSGYFNVFVTCFTLYTHLVDRYWLEYVWYLLQPALLMGVDKCLLLKACRCCNLHILEGYLIDNHTTSPFSKVQLPVFHTQGLFSYFHCPEAGVN